MRKTVLTFGLLSGAVSIAFLLATLPLIDDLRHEIADVLGYTSIVVSALLVFFGVRSYREGAGGGRLTLGRGLAVGALIALVAGVCYAAAFQVVYFQLMPQFGERFTACMVERARESGASDREIVETARQARTLKDLYDRPATNAALTFGTSFPIGLAAAAISAVILRRR